MRIWDDNAGALLGGAEETGNATENISITAASVYVGAYQYGPANNTHDGLIDEVVIIPDVLSSDDIDLIRQGTYGAGGETINLAAASTIVSATSTPVLSVLRLLAASASIASQTSTPALAVERLLSAAASITTRPHPLFWPCRGF